METFPDKLLKISIVPVKDTETQFLTNLSQNKEVTRTDVSPDPSHSASPCLPVSCASSDSLDPDSSVNPWVVVGPLDGLERKSELFN